MKPYIKEEALKPPEGAGAIVVPLWLSLHFQLGYPYFSSCILIRPLDCFINNWCINHSVLYWHGFVRRCFNCVQNTRLDNSAANVSDFFICCLFFKSVNHTFSHHHILLIGRSVSGDWLGFSGKKATIKGKATAATLVWHTKHIVNSSIIDPIFQGLMFKTKNFSTRGRVCFPNKIRPKTEFLFIWFKWRIHTVLNWV